jgi:hypothetical protein
MQNLPVVGALLPLSTSGCRAAMGELLTGDYLFIYLDDDDAMMAVSVRSGKVLG